MEIVKWKVQTTKETECEREREGMGSVGEGIDGRRRVHERTCTWRKTEIAAFFTAP